MVCHLREGRGRCDNDAPASLDGRITRFDVNIEFLLCGSIPIAEGTDGSESRRSGEPASFLLHDVDGGPACEPPHLLEGVTGNTAKRFSCRKCFTGQFGVIIHDVIQESGNPCVPRGEGVPEAIDSNQGIGIR